MTILTVLHVIAGALLAVAAGLALIRIVRGATILDRMIASDVLLTILILVVGAEMVIDGHTRTIPLMLVLTGAAALATISVARYVSKQDRGAGS
jgi:multicomponent Na+:H+ antiporter subunit F